MKKQFLVLVLCLCSLASLAEVGDTISAVAPSGQKLYYKITSPTTVEVVPPTGTSWTGFTKPSGSLTIPSSVTNGGTPYSVTAIGIDAFALCFSLTSASIPTSVTSIGNYAFQDCYSLTSVSIPTSVISIGEGAFQNCSALSNITIPASVANIESRAFQNCPSLATMTVDGSNTHYDSRGNCNAIIETATNTLIAGTKNTVIPNTVTTIGDHAFHGCSGLTTLTIPKLVTSIGNNAFSGCRSLTSVTIPYSVTSIGNKAFSDCSSLTSVTIPYSVTSIGNNAFQDCFSLTSVTIPNSVTSIGNYAFFGCSSLTNVTIVGGVTSIGSFAFANCSQLTHLIVPSTVSLIGSNAFEGIDTVYFRGYIPSGSPWGADMVITTDYRVDGDPLVYESPYKTMVIDCNSTATNVTIPNSVTTIEHDAFHGCSSLTSVTIPNSVTNIGTSAFEGCSGLTGSLTIPNSVTRIGNGAFLGCSSLTSVTIPESVTSIGNFAFVGCGNVTTLNYNAKNLTTSADWYNNSEDYNTYGFRRMPLQTLVIGDSVETLPEGVFYGQSGLTSVTIPESVTTIGNSAFEGCTNVTTLNYNAKNLTTTSDWYNNSEDYNTYGFRRMPLQTLVIGDSVKTLPAGVFYGQDDLTSVTISDSVTTIEKHAFEGCTNVETLYYNATNLTTDNFWYNALDSNNSYGFRPMPLRTLVIGNNVETIPQGVFYNQQGLTSLTIPEAVTRIETAAFYLCSNVTTLNYNATNLSGLGNSVIGGFRPMKLQTLVIGGNVETLPDSVFYSQTNLTNVTLPNSLTSIGAFAFYNDSNLTDLTLPESLTSIGNSAFAHCKGLTSIDFPESLNSIGASAFYNCSALTTLTIPETLTSIGNTAFAYCKGLTSVSLPESMTSLSNGVFQGCSGLTSVTLPNTVTSIEGNAFRGCTGLTGITIPNSVTSIGNNAFMDCNGLTYVTLPNAISIIEDNTFNGCSSLAHITIPQSVTTIDIYAFQNCTSLTNVTIPNSVTTIGASAFSGCTGLESIVIGKSVNSFGDGAFDNCTSLWTIYNLSVWNIEPSSTNFGYGRVAVNAKRVLSAANGDFTIHGTGENTLYRIDYNRNTISDADDVDGLHYIPRSTIPANFIYYYNSNQKGWSWKSNEIFLTDDTSRFVAPVAFTAEKATYTREFTNSNRSTLYLPFAVAEASMPEDLEVYEFSSFNGTSISFAEHTGGIAAYTPYLVGYEISSKDGNPTKCTFNLTNVAFPVTPAASTNAITNNGMTFQGTTQRTCMNSSNYGYSNGYFVQSGNGGDHTGHAHVNPFRCYFTYSASGPMGIPPTLDIDLTNNGLTGIETPDKPVRQNNIRYSDDVFDTMGRLVRKHAKDLEGLPRGIYIWKGKKVLHFND